MANSTQARKQAASVVEAGWTEVHTAALEKVVAALKENAVRALFDPALPAYLGSDASDKGAGMVLRQFRAGRWVTIALVAIRFRGSQLKWGPGVRELYSLLHALRRWWRMLYGAEVIWMNDHHNLLQAEQLSAPFIQRWMMELSLHPAWRQGTRVYMGGEGVMLEDTLSRAAVRQGFQQIIL